MMHAPRLDRCAYGVATSAVSAGNFSFVSLYNEASSPSYIALRDWTPFGVSLAQAFQFVVAQGTVGTLVIQGQPVVTNGAALAGSIYSGAATVLPNASFPTPAGALSAFWPHDFPALILTPGYSLTAYRVTASAALSFGFWWELLWPDQKINPWIGDPNIDE